MDLQDYCKNYKEYTKEKSIFKQLGSKYIISKLALIAIGIYLIAGDHNIFKVLGGLFAGYAIGITVADIRRLILFRKRFEFQKEIIDWEKVDKITKENN